MSGAGIWPSAATTEFGMSFLFPSAESLGDTGKCEIWGQNQGQ